MLIEFICEGIMNRFFKSFTCLNIQNMNGVPVAITLGQWCTCIGFVLCAACKMLQKLNTFPYKPYNF